MLFSVTVFVRNDGVVPIFFGGCGPGALKEIDGVWTQVWVPLCGDNQRGTLAPGDSLAMPITIRAFIKPGIEPQLDPRMVPGTYRLRWGISYAGDRNPAASNQLEALDTPPFKVYQP